MKLASIIKNSTTITCIAFALTACGGGSGGDQNTSTNGANALPAAVFDVVTVAGVGTAGYADGAGSAAMFNAPTAVVVDGAGNVVVADTGNQVLRQISLDGQVSTLAGQQGQAGFQDGDATSEALFDSPSALTLGVQGDVIVADTNNRQIRRVSPAGIVSTLYSRILTDQVDQTQLLVPQGLTSDSAGNLYVSDAGLSKLKKIDADFFMVTLAGDGVAGFADCNAGECARFSQPRGIARDSSGNLYVSDAANNRIRKITPTGAVSTFAGSGGAGFADGAANTAMFNAPEGLVIDSKNNVYVADSNNQAIRRITQSGQVSTVAGKQGVVGSADGPGAQASFTHPVGLAIDRTGNLYVADQGAHTIRKLVLK